MGRRGTVEEGKVCPFHLRLRVLPQAQMFHILLRFEIRFTTSLQLFFKPYNLTITAVLCMRYIIFEAFERLKVR